MAAIAFPRAAVAVGVVAALAGGLAATAGARTLPPQQPMSILIVPSISHAELERLAQRGAVGMLVPGVGPTTNRRQALAALVRGTVKNARLGGVAKGAVLVSANAVTGFPTGHPAIILALPPKGRPILNDRRYPIAVVGRGYRGLLTSRTTRIPGVVSIVDIAPTALQRSGTDLRAVERPDAAQLVERLDRRIAANNQLKLPALIAIAVLVGFLAIFRPASAVPALPAALLGSLGLGFVGPTSVPLLVSVFVVAIVLGGILLERLCTSETRLLALFAAVLVAYLVAMLVDPTAVAVSPLGPTQNSRFFGIGNQVETLLLAPAVAGAALAGRMFGPVGFLLFGGLAFATVADNSLGADGGGAVVLAVALAVLGSRLARLRRYGLLTTLGLGAVGVLTVMWLDERQPGPNHMRSAFSHGLGGLLAVAHNRVPLAYAPAIRQWTFVGPFLLVFLVVVFVALRVRHTPGRRDLVLSITAGVVVSLLVNDSAAYVLTAGITTLVAVTRSPFRFAPLRPLSLRNPFAVVRPEAVATESAGD